MIHDIINNEDKSIIMLLK